MTDMQALSREKVSAAAKLMDSPVWSRYIDRLQLRHLKKYFKRIRSTHRVLELGCGNGRFSFMLAPRCAEIWGIDTNEQDISYCQEKAQLDEVMNANFASASDNYLGLFEDNTFNFVICVTHIEKIIDKADFINILKEIHRVTKKGGRILLLEGISDKRADLRSIALSYRQYFDWVTKHVGDIESEVALELPILRAFARWIYRKVSGRPSEHFVMMALTFFLAPLEWGLPKIFRSPKTLHTLLSVRRR